MEAVIKFYQYAMEEASDPRTSDWFLMRSPWPALFLTIMYLIIVKLGPIWMEKRPAYNLKLALIGYNFLLVLLSAYMFWEFFASSVLMPNFSLTCQPVDYGSSASAMRLASVCWWYFFSKPIEFMDTFFFILRKKNNQVTFLHVYHHSTMVILWWIGVRFVPGGESYFSAMINSLIHVLMYSYYMLSAFGPHMQKYLWWKKYMTSLQLIQFVWIVVHTSIAWYLNCGFPNGYNIALIVYCFSHIILFSNFYHKSYIQKRDHHKVHTNGFHKVSNGIICNEKVLNGINGINHGKSD